MPKKPAGNKRKLPQLTFYVAPQDRNLEEGGSFHPYTAISATSQGKLSFKNSRVKISHHGSGNELASEGVPDDDMDTHSSHPPQTGLYPTLDFYPPLDPEYVQRLEAESGTSDEQNRKRFREQGDESVRDFIPVADIFLSEIITLDGRGQWPADKCTKCGTSAAEYECFECHGRQMMCQACIVDCHALLYLHHIRRWNGQFYSKISLKILGLRIQLGHAPGKRCLNPVQRSTADDFVVIHTNGIHEIGLDFCGCGKSSQLQIVQLLRARLFPATISEPKTAATMEVLDLYDFMSYESKISSFEFYNALAQVTDNLNINPPKDRYPSFICMAHEWRHLMMLKRAGRGHCATGIAGTEDGSCAVLCPACPQPSKNLDIDWEKRPVHKRFLDALFLGTDGNFFLKRKNVSNDQADPGLSGGFSYFVEEKKYKNYLKNYKKEEEPKSSCSRHDAVNLSERRPGQGYAVTGVVGVVCIRHDMNRPNGMAQLQRGERYCNVDYVVWMTLSLTVLGHLILSYDIACQWFKHFLERMAAIDPTFYVLSPKVKKTFLVPKFHLPAHISICRTRFSFNLTKNVGRTDGEAPERGWSPTNKLAASTREMGPGSCRDTLDYHFGDNNHKKVISMGTSLLRKITKAANSMAEHVVEHYQLESTLPVNVLCEWKEEMEKWEDDPNSVPNPFEHEVTGPTQAAVRRQLALYEQEELKKGRDFSLDKTVTPSVLIASGLDLENEQRSFKVLHSTIWDHSQDRQHTKVLLRANTLTRKIEAWIPYQLLYTPGVSRLREISLKAIDHTKEIPPHQIPLWLPSQIGHQAVVSNELRQIEFDLRLAQGREALEDLRHQLQVRAHVFKFKDRFIRGQGANTRARNTLDSIQARITAAATEYRVAYKALQSLGTLLSLPVNDSWRNEFRELADSDIRDLSERKEKESEGRKTTSWIWLVQEQATDSDGRLHDGVRIVWAKSRGRAHRFIEEVQLLSEEMTRVLRFFAWKSQDWTDKTKDADSLSHMSATHCEGLIAYALRQAQKYRDLKRHFECIWKGVVGHILRKQLECDAHIADIQNKQAPVV